MDPIRYQLQFLKPAPRSASNQNFNCNRFIVDAVSVSAGEDLIEHWQTGSSVDIRFSTLSCYAGQFCERLLFEFGGGHER
mmetsp:Transcript_24592/g.51514  ORF Transcript_24592/g.51514 Transcript_24592/m.51514 type:complete len:80 (-) Transcript_24592:5260-5499(-)